MFRRRRPLAAIAFLWGEDSLCGRMDAVRTEPTKDQRLPREMRCAPGATGTVLFCPAERFCEAALDGIRCWLAETGTESFFSGKRFCEAALDGIRCKLGETGMFVFCSRGSTCVSTLRGTRWRFGTTGIVLPGSFGRTIRCVFVEDDPARTVLPEEETP